MPCRKIFTVKGEKEEESVEAYWQVEYADGTILHQYNNNGSKNVYASINRDGVVSFGFVNEFNEYIVKMPVSLGQVFWYRMRVSLLPFSQYTFPHSRRIYLCGKREKTVEGQIVDVIYVVDTNGNVKQYLGFSEQAFLSEPVWKSFEMV